MVFHMKDWYIYQMLVCTKVIIIQISDVALNADKKVIASQNQKNQ